MKTILRATAVVAFAFAASAAYAETNASSTTLASPGGEMFLLTPAAGSHLASHLIGSTVYTGEQADADAIGEINDLIVAQDGSIDAAIIGVGGFLGAGEKNVAVDFEQLAWVTVPDADQPTGRLILAATADQLMQVPDFDVSFYDTDPAYRLTGDVAANTVNPNVAAPADGTVAQTQTMPAQDLLNDPAYTAVDVATISANELTNATVYSGENENVGSVGDVILADDGTIDAVVLDIGGFLGLGQKPVAIAFDALTIRRDDSGNLFVFTGFSRAQLEGAVDYNADRYRSERETMRLSSS